MHDARTNNRAIWEDINGPNPLRIEMQAFGDRVLQMALGNEPKSQMLIAPHGCDKGTVIERAVAAAGKAALMIDKVTSNSLPFVLEACANPDTIGVVDDRDQLLQDLVCLEHLSKATGSADDGFSGSGSAFTLMRAQSFSYTGARFAITSNVDPRDPSVSSKKVSEAWKKLARRIQIRKIVASEEQRYQYTCYQIICDHVLRRSVYTTHEINEVLEFRARNRHRIADPSVGGVKDMLSARRRYPDWRDHFLEPHDLRPKPELGPIPMIVAADKTKRVKSKLPPVPLKPRIATLCDTPAQAQQAQVEEGKRGTAEAKAQVRVEKAKAVERVKADKAAAKAAAKSAKGGPDNVIRVVFGRAPD